MIDTMGNIILAQGPDGLLGFTPKMANRHGLITGATGTGKTVTMQVAAESLAAIGVPVFITDIKGDVSGIGMEGGGGKAAERAADMGLDAAGFRWGAVPVRLWDLFGRDGHPLRTTVSEMGPMLLARVLDLNPTQTDVLAMLFRIADDSGMLLLDLKDLRKMTEYVMQNRKDFTGQYGNMATATLSAIQRGLLTLEDQGGDVFFGEPALDWHDIMARQGGTGTVNILSAGRLMQSPRVYGSFLLWLLSELYENLPEAGDLDQPKLVFFFDEAHLIFNEAPKILLERIEQVVRLIRSKGVGIFFVTQNPADVPQAVLAQLGNRVQHALRAYTPAEQKAVRAAASAFRANPAFKTEEAITQLGVGEALVSFLDEQGVPCVVQRARIVPPQSRIGPMGGQERADVIRTSPLAGKYDSMIDRESAYEILTQRIEDRMRAEEEARQLKALPKAKQAQTGGLSGFMGDFAKKTQQSITRNIANQVGRSLIRGVLGGLFGGKR